jgi:hypothetical protein
MELTLDSVVASTSRLVAADLGEDVMILHLEDGLYFGLADVSARIWKLLEKPLALREIGRVLVKEYDVDPERCHEEVLHFVSGLVERRLVEVRNP